MEILQLLCVTRTMNKGDLNYEHFAEHMVQVGQFFEAFQFP